MNLATYPEWVIPNSLDVCARSELRWAHSSQNPTVPGTDLCGSCHAKFPRLLGDLVAYWPLLQEAHVKRPARSRDYTAFQRNAGGGGTPNDAGALWNPAAGVAIAELVDWTRFLMRTILRDRRFYGHEILGFTDATSTPIDIALAQVALHHGRWMTSYPSLGPSLIGDAIRLRLLAMKALDQPSVRRVNMTHMFCDDVVESTEYGDITCGGQMAGIIPADGAWAIETGPALILCSANPAHTRIEARDWILAR